MKTNVIVTMARNDDSEFVEDNNKFFVCETEAGTKIYVPNFSISGEKEEVRKALYRAVDKLLDVDDIVQIKV